MSDAPRQMPHPPEVPKRTPTEPPGWFDKARNVRLLKWIAIAFVVALFAIDFFLHYHGYLGPENVPGFHTLFGFVASVILIASAKLGGKPLKREEDHYDE